MRNFLNTAVAAAMILVSSATLISCNKEFDNPPSVTDPAIVANTTIKDLKAMHTVSGAYNTVTTDVIISGIVVADDRSGNLYKQLFIQDSTGAINILLDATNLFGTYPVGRKVFIKCNGLTVSDYHGLIQLGYKATINGAPSLEAIPSALISGFVVGGSINNPVVPKVVTATQLTTSMQDPNMGALIQLNNYEFDLADLNKTFGDTSAYKNSNDLYISLGCGAASNTRLDVRSSGYANFAGVKPPSGNGNILSIYTVYNTTKQLLIRDTSDIKFTNARCGGVTPPGGGTGTLTTIAQLRAMYTGSNIKINSSMRIGGVVISDAANKNISAGTVILQDGDAGISVYFGGTITYNVGDSIVLDITGDSLLNYRSSLEIKTPSGTAQPAAVATGKVITPKVKTIAEVNATLGSALGSAGNFEFTLIKIVNGTASGGTTYAGNRTLTDASGNTVLYTAAAATFSATALPTTPKTWVGFANNFNTTKEFQIRNLSDVQ